LGISVKTRANTQVNKAFYESFVLQATFTLDGDLCSDVKAKDATIAAAGKDHTVAFTALPGHDGDFELSAQVKDFEMPAAQIAALPYSTVVEMPDTDELESGLNDLADAVSQLSDGTSKLADGVEELSSGAGDLADGADAFGDGLSQLASSSDQIVDASAQVKKSLGQIAGALGNVDLSGLDDLKKYAPMLREAAETLDALRTVMQELDDGYARMAQTLDVIAGIIDANPLSDEEIAALRAEVADNPEAAAALERLLAMYDAMHAAIDDYHAAGGTPETIEAQLKVLFADGGELDQAVQALRTAAGYLDGGSLEQMGQLAGGLSQLSSGYSQFHSGLVDYTDGVQELNKNYRKLSSGVSDLADGTSQLSGGANELSDGVAELARATSDLPTQMRERMDEMMADYDFLEFKPVSFVDARNKNVTAVQFVLLTDAIEKPKPAPAEPAPKPEPTILDRFFDLFGL
jgi:X-X-X-Leu-X-X-Gly heptad repeat protein